MTPHSTEQCDLLTETNSNDDYSHNFHKIRSRLTDTAGNSYTEFMRGLQPDYPRVMWDIAFGYAMLLVSGGICVALGYVHAPHAVAIAVGAVLFGYWIAYLQLFIHEAAHFNLAATKAESDRRGNLLIAWMIGTSVAKYRKVHFQHHRALGTVADSEYSYFFPLNLAFVLRSLCGIRALEVLLDRSRGNKLSTRSPGLSQSGSETGSQRSENPSDDRAGRMMIVGLVAHGTIMVLAWCVGSWPLAAAWILGVSVVFPFFAAIRPLLEHRSDLAQANTDYHRTDHGAYTRLFGDDLFSGTFGGAGFNRHLLHHWEPQVSYTNLGQLEEFLRRTSLNAVMDSRRTTYWAVVQRLFSL
jgi:fatty acid desaturase